MKNTEWDISYLGLLSIFSSAKQLSVFLLKNSLSLLDSELLVLVSQIPSESHHTPGGGYILPESSTHLLETA